MKKILIPAFIIVVLLAGLITQIAAGDTDVISISGADAQVTHDFLSSSTLNALISAVPVRFIFQYADTNVLIFPETPSPTLQNLLLSVPARVVIQYGDTNRLIRSYFPVDLIGDTISPQISSLLETPSGNNSYEITWDTEEYAKCICDYGTTSGVYPESIEEDFYEFHHEANLINLTIGSPVYYQIECSDRSANIFQSDEFSFIPEELDYIYLPMLIR